MGIIYNICAELFKTFNKKIIQFKLPAQICNFCGRKTATWRNKISEVRACNKCVPKSCLCRLNNKVKRASFLISNTELQKNKKEHDIPCKEWDEI